MEDDGPPPGNPWRGYQLCLRAIPPEATHAVIIQDDALVCASFSPALERLVRAVPDNLVCLFYSGLPMRSSRAQRKADQRGKSLFLLHPGDFLPVVAVLWPRVKAEHLRTWMEGVDRIPGLHEPYRSDDAVIGYWMRMTRQDVYVALPSLVEHPDDVDPVKDGPHKAAHGADRGRVALRFCTGDPLEIEWST